MAMPIKSDARVAKLSQREEENESRPTKYFQKIKADLNTFGNSNIIQEAISLD